jgi:hypothetical protein
MTKQKLWNNLTRLLVYIVSVAVSNFTYGLFLTVNIGVRQTPVIEDGSFKFTVFGFIQLLVAAFILNPLPLYLLIMFFVRRIRKS